MYPDEELPIGQPRAQAGPQQRPGHRQRYRPHISPKHPTEARKLESSSTLFSLAPFLVSLPSLSHLLTFPHVPAGGGNYGSVVLDDCNFHDCVRLDEFESSRTLSFLPPDGEFALLNYRITQEFRAPFRIFPTVEETSPTKVRPRHIADSWKRRSIGSQIGRNADWLDRRSTEAQTYRSADLEGEQHGHIYGWVWDSGWGSWHIACSLSRHLGRVLFEPLGPKTHSLLDSLVSVLACHSLLVPWPSSSPPNPLCSSCFNVSAAGDDAHDSGRHSRGQLRRQRAGKAPLPLMCFECGSSDGVFERSSC